MIGRGNATEAEVTGGKHRRDSVVPIRAKVIGTIMNDRPAYDPAAPTATVSYRVRAPEVPCCPGCGQTQWLIGRTMAECGFCSLALPLDHSNR